MPNKMKEIFDAEQDQDDTKMKMMKTVSKLQRESYEGQSCDEELARMKDDRYDCTLPTLLLHNTTHDHTHAYYVTKRKLFVSDTK